MCPFCLLKEIHLAHIRYFLPYMRSICHLILMFVAKHQLLLLLEIARGGISSWTLALSSLPLCRVWVCRVSNYPEYQNGLNKAEKGKEALLLIFIPKKLSTIRRYAEETDKPF